MATAEPPTATARQPTPFAAAGKTNSPIGAATHRKVARWLVAKWSRSEFAVYVGSAEWFTPAVAVDAGSPGSIATGVNEVDVPAVVVRLNAYSPELSAGVALDEKIRS